jgi:signal transduction histidine kinase
MRRDIASIDRAYAERFKATDDLQSAIRITIALAILIAVLVIAANGYYAERRSVELEEEMLRTIIGERDAEARRSEWRTKIIAMLAHDFRSSLSVIRAYAEMLEHFPEKRSDESAYQVIEKTVEDLTAMSEDALLMARVSSSDGLTVKLGPQRIYDVVHEASQRYTSERVIRISDSGDLVMGDRPYLIRVFDNLIGNAVKYSPQGSPIDVRIKPNGARDVEVSVTDHGRGIDPADLPHVFDEFWRAKSSSDHSGSGIGLFIVKKIVDAHGGSTSIQSEPGAGTTVRVTLPVALA